MSDRIEKRVLLRAPVSRVWRALTDPAEFGRWFGVEILDPFVVGAQVRASFGADALPLDLIAAHQRSLGLEPSPVRPPPPGAHFCTVRRLAPETCFAFEWTPFGIDAEVAPGEPPTLVEFTLTPAPGGTELRIVESGFDRIPAHRRRRAFLMNDGGWAAQAENVRRYVDGG